MSNPVPSVRLSITGHTRLLPVVRSAIEAFCQAARIDEKSTHAILLASTEAITNVMQHAHRETPDAEIEIGCRLLADGVEVCVMDQGEPFDLTSAPDLDPGELRAGGRGLFIMRRVMDELTCEPRPVTSSTGTGNLVRMFKRCGSDISDHF